MVSKYITNICRIMHHNYSDQVSAAVHLILGIFINDVFKRNSCTPGTTKVNFAKYLELHL